MEEMCPWRPFPSLRTRKATVRPSRVVGYLICGDGIVVILILYLGVVQIFTARFS